MKFEDAVNYTRVAILVGCVAFEGYKLYTQIQDQNAKDAADDWELEASARFNAMVNHAKRNRISKAGFVEALEAAKNVLAFEGFETLEGNIYAGRAVRNLHSKIDAIIATV